MFNGWTERVFQLNKLFNSVIYHVVTAQTISKYALEPTYREVNINNLLYNFK